MSKPIKAIPEICENYILYEGTVEYSRKEVLLYALGLGISRDPMDIKDLQFTYENSENFSVIPTFATTLISFNDIFDGLTRCPGLPHFNPMLLLHASQKICLYSKLCTEGKIKTISKIKGVFSKSNGILILIECTSSDFYNNKVLFTNEVLLYIRGILCEGSSASFVSPLEDLKKIKPPSRSPDVIITRATTQNQALIYRLSGDFNPLHADPNMAVIGGFERPILHGLCTLGIATHSIIKEVLNNSSDLVSSVAGRFVSPVIPGDSMIIKTWMDKNQINFDVLNENTNKICISNGLIETSAANMNDRNSKL